MDRRMSDSIWRVEKLPSESPTPEFPYARRTSLSLPCHLSDVPVSITLIRDDNGVQWPIYYVSNTLQEAKPRYPDDDMLALAVIISARKLRPYFQVHPIVVMTDRSLRQTLGKLDASGRLVKWSMELGEFNIEYRLRTAIKGQAVADFVTELTTSTSQLETRKLKPSKIYMDGSSNTKQEV